MNYEILTEWSQWRLWNGLLWPWAVQILVSIGRTGKKKISSENGMKKYASLIELLPKQNKIVFPSIFAELEIKLTDTCYLKLVTWYFLPHFCYLFGHKIFFNTKYFLSQYFFEPNTFVSAFFWTRNCFRTRIFWTQTFLDKKKISGQKSFKPKNLFGPKIVHGW